VHGKESVIRDAARQEFGRSGSGANEADGTRPLGRNRREGLAFRGVYPSTDQKIQAPLHEVGQAGRSLHFSRIKQFARSVGVSLPMQPFSQSSLQGSSAPPEALNS
jgi:hypothetical protein